MNVSPGVSQKIKNMSILCALLVVVIHVKWAHAEFGATWLMENIVHLGIAQIAVPFFFVVSGYFLSAHFEEDQWWGKEIKKRIFTLMIPFFIWHLICFLFTTPQSIVADVVAHRPFGSSVYLFHPNLLHLLGLDIQEGLPALGPLWYVRALFLLVCVAPIIKWCVDKMGLIWLVVAFLAKLTFSYCENAGVLGSYEESFWLKFLNFGFPLTGLLYLSIGCYIRNRGIAMGRRWTAWIAGMLGLFMIVVNAALKYKSVNVVFPLEQLMIPCVMYYVWSIVPSCHWPSYIADISFPLYVVHSVLRPYTKYAQKVGSWGAFLEFLILVVGSFVIIVVMRMYAPRFFAFLFAGRGAKNEK